MSDISEMLDILYIFDILKMLDISYLLDTYICIYDNKS